MHTVTQTTQVTTLRISGFLRPDLRISPPRGWPGGGPGVARGWPGGGPGGPDDDGPAEGHCDEGTGDEDPGDEGPGNDTPIPTPPPPHHEASICRLPPNTAHSDTNYAVVAGCGVWRKSKHKTKSFF